MTRRSTLGSIREVKPGQWVVQVSGGFDANGKRIRLTKRVTGTRREAERARSRLLAEVDSIQPDEHLTLGDFLETRWLPYKQAKERSPLTTLNYEAKIRSHIAPYAIARTELEKITPYVIDQWLMRLRREGGTRGPLSEQTLHHIFATLRAALRQAVVWRLIPYDPTAGVDTPKPERFRGHTLTIDEASLIIEACKERPLGAAHALALGGGLRRGEVAGLAWSDISFGPRTQIAVRRQVIEVPGVGSMVRSLKTREGHGTLTLPQWTVEILQQFQVNSARHRLATGLRPALGVPDLLFLDPEGQPIAPQALSKDFRRMRQQLELPYMRLHDMRHGMARLMRKAGVELDIIQQRLRHTRISTTQHFYMDTDMDLDQEAVAKFDHLLGRDAQ